MPRYKLILLDASGKSRSAIVEAGSQAEAIDLARRKGYQVRQIEVIHDLEANGEPLAPVETAEHGSGFAPPQFSQPLPARPNAVFLLLPTLLAGLAFLIAVGTLVYVLLRSDSKKAEPDTSGIDFLGSGVARYDFSNPKAAYESMLKIEKDRDMRAVLELQRKTDGKRLQEKLDTYEIRKEVDYKGKKGLFISYQQDGVRKYEVGWFEQDAGTGYWVEAHGMYSFEIEKDNRDLAEQIRRFESSGEVPSIK